MVLPGTKRSPISRSVKQAQIFTPERNLLSSCCFNPSVFDHLGYAPLFSFRSVSDFGRHQSPIRIKAVE